MNRETQSAVLILLAIHLASKVAEFAPLERARAKVKRAVETVNRTVEKRAVDPAKQSGARVYDVLHDDSNHQQDLPGSQLTREAVLAIAKNAGFADPKLAAAIALAESGGVTNALARSSREISVGLWQINTMIHPYSASDMRNPLKNAAAAFKISKGGTNWRPWTSFNNGAYLKFRTGILK